MCIRDSLCTGFSLISGVEIIYWCTLRPFVDKLKKKKGWLWPGSRRVKNQCDLQTIEKELPSTKDNTNLLEKIKMLERERKFEASELLKKFRKLELENQSMSEEMRKIKANIKDDDRNNTEDDIKLQTRLQLLEWEVQKIRSMHK